MFDSVIRTTVTWEISKENFTAKVKVPELIPGINFFPPQKHPFFKVVTVIGVIPDLFSTGKGYQPLNELNSNAAESSTPWMPAKNALPTTTLEVKLASAPPDHASAFLLSIGVAFGAPDGEAIKRTRHAGAARILSVVGNSETQ